ncbi:MAG: RNA degradosome polyphosphate kinase [Lachnospiraceae bacterium]|nr:RNA degradosome polyphosphate kinase [Lachnospiraceae bacterium]
MKNIDYSKPEYYENRELSWLKFNQRVLYEAMDEDTPLFERLKFLSITASNLDEFIMVRVASLNDMENAGYGKRDIAGLTVSEQRELISKAVHRLVKTQYDTYNNDVIPLLETNGLKITGDHGRFDDLDYDDRTYLDRYFENEVYPVLTPMAVDSSRPFPLIRNRSLNIGALVRKKGGDGELEFATVQVPSVLNRIVELPPEADGTRRITFLEDIIAYNIEKLFLNYDIVEFSFFRITRSADFSFDEDEADDLLKEIEKQVRLRAWGETLRLEVDHRMNEKLLDIIREELDVSERGIYKIEGPLDLTVLMKMYGLNGFDDLKERSYSRPQEYPYLPDGCDIFEKIAERDMLLFHPFQTFEPVVRFVSQAASDPQVLAIKQTLYRVSGNSPIIAALAEAAENGKQVTVLVELKARFDEENNILWAKRLEKAGCHVIYGLVGLKTHSKITLVVRKEEDGIRRYVHLGTGNYNDSTAKLYTDIGLLTADEEIGEDATAVFNMLSGYSEPRNWNKLSLAPLWLKDRFLFLIDREKQHALRGEKGHMICKMNSICDADIIKALYEAAQAGVNIELIVRGICAIKLSTPDIGENIKVRSIVGNFLEHARIFYFENGGSPEYYCSSADWMPRNLERRVEILFPVEDESLRKKLDFILQTQLNDNVKAFDLQKDGSYLRKKDQIRDDRNDKDDIPEETINSQLIFCERATKIARELGENRDERVFIPRMSHA